MDKIELENHYFRGLLSDNAISPEYNWHLSHCEYGTLKKALSELQKTPAGNKVRINRISAEIMRRDKGSGENNNALPDVVDKPKRKTKTSTDVKRRYNESHYRRFGFSVPTELGERFLEKCQEKGVAYAALFKEYIEKFLKNS